MQFFHKKCLCINLIFLNLNENNWHGSKICLKKNFKSPQWLRNLKFKKYPFWRIDKQKKIFKLLIMVVGILHIFKM